MIFVLVISLYTSRVVLNALGVVDYGIYNVVGGFVLLFGFLNATLSSSMQRFYNYEGTLDKEYGFHRVYSTGLVIHILLCIAVLLILETAGLWYVNSVMVIPTDRIISANIVYQMSVLSMLFVILQIPYMGVIMATEKMSFYAYLSLADSILKLVAVLGISYIPYDHLSIYSIIITIITFINFLFYFLYAKKLILKKRFKWEIDKRLFKLMVSFSCWNMLGTFAFLLKGQGLNMLLNVFFGPIVNAARGIAFQVNNALNNLSANLAIAFRPQIVNSFAENNQIRVTRLMFLESKSSFLLVAMMMLPIIFRIDYILKLWLGSEIPEQTNIFTILLLIDALICTLNTPITQVAMAVGDIKHFQIASTVVNILLIPICWFALYIGYSAVIVFVLTILFSIINQIVCIVQLKRIFLFSIKDYLTDVCLRPLVSLVSLLITLYIISSHLPEDIIGLLFLCLCSIILCLIYTYAMSLNRVERKYVRDILVAKFINK